MFYTSAIFAVFIFLLSCRICMYTLFLCVARVSMPVMWQQTRFALHLTGAYDKKIDLTCGWLNPSIDSTRQVFSKDNLWKLEILEISVSVHTSVLKVKHVKFSPNKHVFRVISQMKQWMILRFNDCREGQNYYNICLQKQSSPGALQSSVWYWRRSLFSARNKNVFVCWSLKKS